MAVGRLGSWEIYPAIYQSVYKCNTDDVSVVNLSICNRSSSPTYIRVAITATVNSPLDNEFIEYDVKLNGHGVLERSGLIIPTGSHLTVRSLNGKTSAVVWGHEIGADSGDPQPSQNLGQAPTWNSAANLGTVYEGYEMFPIQLDADDPDGGLVSYAQTSGSVPTGMNIASDGTISGLIQEGDAYDANGIQYNFTVTASDALLSTPRAFSIIRAWAPGSVAEEPIVFGDSITNAILTSGQTTGDIFVEDSVGNVVQTKLFTTNNTTGLGTNADYAQNSNTGWALLCSISDDTTHGQQTAGNGSWRGSWTDTNEFGNFQSMFSDQSYKNALYHNWEYKDILIMQFVQTPGAGESYFDVASEVAYTNTEWLLNSGSNLRDFLRGTNGPDIRTNGASGRVQIPLTFLKGSAENSEARYRPNSRGELVPSNEIDWGRNNSENYRYSVINALGCRSDGANIEHHAWVGDVDTNYSERNFPEPNWTGDWGIDTPNGRLTWLIFGTN